MIWHDEKKMQRDNEEAFAKVEELRQKYPTPDGTRQYTTSQIGAMSPDEYRVYAKDIAQSQTDGRFTDDVTLERERVEQERTQRATEAYQSGEVQLPPGTRVRTAGGNVGTVLRRRGVGVDSEYEIVVMRPIGAYVTKAIIRTPASEITRE